MYKKFDAIMVAIEQTTRMAFANKVKGDQLEVCFFDDESGSIKTETISVDQVTKQVNENDLPFALKKVLEHNCATQTFKKGTKVKWRDKKTKVLFVGVIDANMGDYARVILTSQDVGESKRVAKVLLSEV